MVAFGPQPHDWLPNQNWEFRPTNFWWWLEEDADSGLLLTAPNHPLFENYLTLNDCTWHQHGVFWPPVDAETLIASKNGGVVMYQQNSKQYGRWVITTLDPDYHFGSYFMPATEKFLEGFFPYLAYE